MSSLKEIKNRIGSVKSTLKITSAMKLVASAKLRKAQTAIEAMAPYQKALGDALARLSAGGVRPDMGRFAGVAPGDGSPEGKTAIVAVSSNSSLCGGFNGNVARRAAEEVASAGGEVVLYALGRKVADSMRKFGLHSEGDFTSLVARPTYDAAASLAEELVRRFSSGEFSKVLLVYTHFVTAARQEVKVEQYLPFVSEQSSNGEGSAEDDIIVEPDADSVLRDLLPKVLSLKIYAMVLDSAAAEHAARTIAMQTATDNGNDILSELTIEYNKGRQNKITSEILDLVGGSIGNQ